MKDLESRIREAGDISPPPGMHERIMQRIQKEEARKKEKPRKMLITTVSVISLAFTIVNAGILANAFSSSFASTVASPTVRLIAGLGSLTITLAAASSTMLYSVITTRRQPKYLEFETPAQEEVINKV